MKRGIVYIAFGSDYCLLAAHTIYYSRQFTDLPITVLTNIPENLRCKKWADVKNIDFIHLPYSIDENRAVKTQLYKYTPYDQTLYMDCDSIIQKPGIEMVFEGLKTNHIVFQLHKRWEKYKKYYDIYRRAAKQFDCDLPLDILIGGFFCFANTTDVQRFFDLWLEYWEDFGKGRDMPPLACAVQNSGIHYTTITKQNDKLFSFGINNDCIAIHRVHGDDLARFNLPVHQQHKPFDKGHRDDWVPVYFELRQNPWLAKKVNTQLADKRERKYIVKRLPEIRTGGKDILDIGCGFGQFLICCRRYRNRPVGIVPPLDRYAGKIGINNSDSLDYELYSRERLDKNRLNYVECDFLEAIDSGTMPLNGTKFDIINCKHSINLILKRHFDFKRTIPDYKNDGEWKLGDDFNTTLDKLFQLINRYLKPGGIFYVTALTALNSSQYSDAMIAAAGRSGFLIEADEDNRHHKFTRLQ